MATTSGPRASSRNGTARQSEKSFSALASDLSREITSLVHDEFELAKSEMTQKARRARSGAGMFGTAGALGLVGLLCLAACAIAAIATALSVWLSALIVGAGCLVLAALMALVGRGQLTRATPPVPEAALESAKEDVEWLKTHATSGKR
jgi:hypothetical protein